MQNGLNLFDCGISLSLKRLMFLRNMHTLQICIFCDRGPQKKDQSLLLDLQGNSYLDPDCNLNLASSVPLSPTHSPLSQIPDCPYVPLPLPVVLPSTLLPQVSAASVNSLGSLGIFRHTFCKFPVWPCLWHIRGYICLW